MDPVDVIHEAVLAAINAEADALRELHVDHGRSLAVDAYGQAIADAYAHASPEALVALWQEETLAERFAREHALALPPLFASLLTVAAIGSPALALEHFQPLRPLPLRLPPVAAPLPLICRDAQDGGIVAAPLPLLATQSPALLEALATFHGCSAIRLVCSTPESIRQWCVRQRWAAECAVAPPAGPRVNGVPRPLFSLAAFRAPMKEAPWNQLPSKILTNSAAAPVWCAGSLVTLAVAPDVPGAVLADLRTVLAAQDRHVRFLHAPAAEVERFVDSLQGRVLEEQAQRAARQIEVTAAPDSAEEIIKLSILERGGVAQLDPAVTIVQTLLLEAIRRRASDLQIKQTRDQLRVRFNLNDLWEDVPQGFASGSAENVMARLKNLADLPYERRLKPLDGALRVRADFGSKGERSFLFRLNAVRDVDGQRITLRPQDNSQIPRLEQLQIPAQVQHFLRRMLRRRQGLFVVVGPTGSGKTTTLHACLDSINRPGINIVTAESPVERLIPGINQMEVPETQPDDPGSPNRFTYADAMRASLRQKPNVILIGELRDEETVEVSLAAANTGHLVLSTIHVNSVYELVMRFLSLGANPVLMSQTLRGALGQRLVRLACPQCSQRGPLTREHLLEFGFEEKYFELGAPVVEEFNERGCPQCQHGVVGRRAVFEILSIERPVDRALLSSVSIAAHHGRTMPDGSDSPAEVMAGRMSELGYPSLVETVCRAAATGEIPLSEAAQYL